MVTETTNSDLLSDTLHNLVVDQRHALQAEQLPDLSTRKQLLTFYKGSERFYRLYGRAFSFYLVPHTDQELQRARDYLAGGIFQDLAYDFLSQRIPDYQVLLSPERTLKFYQNLFPGKPVVNHDPFGSDSIQGISVPDGIIVETAQGGREKIVFVCEYTANGQRRYFEAKYAAFNMDRGYHPKLFADSKPMFVTPMHNDIPTILKVSSIQLEQLPFQHEQFRDFIDNIYSLYPPPDQEMATLTDLQARARDQVARVKTYHAAGQLTHEYRKYISRLGVNPVLKQP